MQAQTPMQPQLRKYIYQKAARDRTPVSGTFELTPRCNMNCRMCYIRMSEEEMNARGREYTADEWIRMGRVCAQRGMLFLLFTGGEPFLRKDFRKIYTELKKLGLDEFEKNIRSLAYRWFSQSPQVKNESAAGAVSGDMHGLEALEEYIVNGGVFGNSVNEQVNNALRYGGKGKFLRTVIFPSYRTMQSVFPWLNSPIQLPMAWINRWWNVWTKRRANIRGQFERADQISDQDRIYIEKQKKFFRRYGL